MNKRIKLLLVPVLAVILIASLILVDVTIAQTGISKQSFEWIVAKRISVDSDLSVGDDLTVTDNATITGAATVGETLGVTGNTTLGGTLATAGNATMAGTLGVTGATALAADTTLATDATGGNALAKTEYIGLPRITMLGIGTLANGTTNTSIVDIGDSETPATDWTAVDADTVMSNDATYYRHGTASLKMAVAATADDTDGCTNALATGDQDWSDDEALGFWFLASKALDAGDITLEIHDATAGGGFTDVNLPAVTVPNVWQWVELDVTLSNNNLKDVITDLSFTLSAAGAAQALAGAFDVYFDFIVKWDVAEEEALGQAIPYDGVLGLTIVDATSAAATSSNLTLYTDYFVHYQTGNDAIVIITDQSGADIVGLALFAY